MRMGKYGKEFPLLIKIIDARSDLSIQVHPDNDYAREHEMVLWEKQSAGIFWTANQERRSSLAIMLKTRKN